MIGKKAYVLAKDLWPFNRSITGEGVRKTLNRIKKVIPGLKIVEVKTGTQAFDWKVPKEWHVREAWIKDPKGRKICDFKKNNLHLVGYSTPTHVKIDKSDLMNRLHSIPSMPTAIPYITSYYNKNWGFCISHNQKKKLINGTYEVYIDSKLFNGSLTYGELLIKGKQKKEIFLSTYICHPSMANDQISGICVTTYLADWILKLANRKYSYRIIFIPETIGSLVYLSRNLKKMKKNIIAGFNITCVGDEKNYSFLPSKNGNTLSDIVSEHVIKHVDENFLQFNWSDRGSDERQYCAPHIDLPVVSLMRSKYGYYKEYHTSLDNLKKIVTPNGLQGGYELIKLAIEALEKNCFPYTKIYGEPFMSKRNFFPDIEKLSHRDKTASKDGRRNYNNIKDKNAYYHLSMDIISLSDGKNSLLDIANFCKIPIWSLYPIIDILKKNKILSLLDEKEIFDKINI